MPMATKFGRLVEYIVKVPPIKSHDPLIKWFEVSDNLNTLYLQFLQLEQWPPNMASW